MESILDLAEPWAYVVITLLAIGESGAGLGLFLPGEPIMLLGGVLVYEGRADLVPMVLCAWLGSVVGDVISFYLGRRFGPRLRRTTLGRKVGEERWNRADAYLGRHGGKAVLAGKFVGVMRALLPAIAGAGGMPWRKYLAVDIPASLVFGGGFVALGELAGSSWHLVDRWFGHAVAVALAVGALVAALVFAVRQIRDR
jgi:membrane-associated protein